MKVYIIKKFKWYIVGFILVAIMLSVSLSFSTWDSLSAKAGININSGKYSETPVVGLGNILLVDDKYLADGSLGVNGSVDIGDIVTYGNFYQDADAVITGITTALRWIVVDYNATTKIATLLSEKVVVYGNYWGNSTALNDYYRSTVRSWLNSGKGSLKGSGTTWKDSERYDDNVRNDGVNNNLAFNINESNQVNKGFLDVAFSTDEKSILLPKNIAGMKYTNKGIIESCVTNGTNSNTINDLVWLPSWKEVYGINNVPSGDTSINNEIHFGYYASNTANTIKISGATAYACNAASSSYYNNGGGSPNGSASATWCWLRSSSPSHHSAALVVSGDSGSGSYAYANTSYGGVRPAVYVKF